MNDNEQQTLFNFHNHRVRVVTIDDSPWFAAIDVCRAIGLANLQRGVGQYLGRVSEDERRSLTLDVDKGNPKLNMVSESGLYKLVLRSDKDTAKEFQDWITRDVLPAIRKDGMYVMGEEKIDSSDDAALDRLAEQVIEGEMGQQPIPPIQRECSL